MSMFLMVMVSGHVIKDWDNPEPVELLNDDNIIDSQTDFFNYFSSSSLYSSDSYPLQLKTTSDYKW